MPGLSASRLCSTVLAIAAVASSACGRIHQRSERWIAEKTPGTSIWLGLEPTRTDEDDGMFGDREIRETGPYTAHVQARGEHVDTPLRVHALRLVVGDEVTQLHEEAAALEAALERGSEGQDSWARVKVPLGDRLVWRDGDVVALEVDATLPWDAAPTTTRRELRAVLEESSGSKFEAFMSQ